MTGHMTTDRKCSPFYSVQSSSPGIVSPTIRVCGPTSVSPLKKLPHRHAQRFVSQAILDPVMLTINVSYHRFLANKGGRGV